VWKEKLHIDDTSKGWHIFRLVRTNVLVFLGRYITRAPRLLTALWMVKQTFLHPQLSTLPKGALMAHGLGYYDFGVIFVGILILLAVEWQQEKGVHLRATLEEKSPLVQWLGILVSVCLLFFFGILRPDYIASDFIYKQF
jgi:hypothetical protein